MGFPLGFLKSGKELADPPRCLRRVQGGWEAGPCVETQRRHTWLEQVRKVLVIEGPTDSADSEGLGAIFPVKPDGPWIRGTTSW